MRLMDKVTIVTGAAQGIGEATAVRFAMEGSHVIVCDINGDGVRAVSRKLQASGRRSSWFQVDVTNSLQVVSMVEATIVDYGRIDILVNSAGGSFNLPNKLEEITDEIWDKVVDVNLKGTFICSRTVAPHMKKQKSGRIINIASKAAKYGGELTGIQYSSAKAGVTGLTRQLARDLGPFGITTNAIAPGLVLSSPRLESLWKERKTEDERREFLKSIPLGRLATVDELVSVILFLASDDASYVNGATIDVNGGWFMS